MSRGAAKLQAGPVELPDGPPPRREVVSTAAGVVAQSVSAPVVALYAVMLRMDRPWSGTTAGSGTPTPAPPK